LPSSVSQEERKAVVNNRMKKYFIY